MVEGSASHLLFQPLGCHGSGLDPLGVAGKSWLWLSDDMTSQSAASRSCVIYISRTISLNLYNI